MSPQTLARKQKNTHHHQESQGHKTIQPFGRERKLESHNEDGHKIKLQNCKVSKFQVLKVARLASSNSENCKISCQKKEGPLKQFEKAEFLRQNLAPNSSK
ncbi:unnamed protein product [Sphagnum jensenii]|uniref:Uncharacterized protein n=1 Tax=Sphagnum jensenii TaxID=128206 RepID=A0ABP0XM22_9BRYO